MKHPVYLLLVAVACGYVATANSRGWSLIRTATTGMRAGLGGWGSTFIHK